MKILHRGRLTWRIKSDSLLVYDKHQATLYVGWAQPRSALFAKMRDRVVNSDVTEYCDWSDVLDLASKYGVYGLGTKIPLDGDLES